MKTHKNKQKQVRKETYKKKIKIGGDTMQDLKDWKGPVGYIKKHYARTKENLIKSSKESEYIRNKKLEERGNRRFKYVRGQLGDLGRSIGHTIKNIQNPIVTAYQLIEEHVFGWGVTKQVKPAFEPKHKSVSFKQFLKSDIPEFTEKKKKETEEKKTEEEEKKKKEEEKKKKEEEKKKALEEIKRISQEIKEKEGQEKYKFNIQQLISDFSYKKRNYENKYQEKYQE